MPQMSTEYFRSAWRDVWRKVHNDCGCCFDAESLDFADCMATLGHNVAVAGALMAAEDRGYRSGYRTGKQHGAGEEALRCPHMRAHT